MVVHILIGTISFGHTEARSHHLALFPNHVDSYCLFMDTAGSLRMCAIMHRGFLEFTSWLYLYLSRPSLLSMLPANLHECQSISVYQQGPVPVVLLAIWRQVDQCWMLGFSGLYHTRLCWEDPIPLGMIGNINAFITEMRSG